MAFPFRLPKLFKKKSYRPKAVEECLSEANPTMVQKVIPSLWARRRLLVAVISAILALALTWTLNLSSPLKALIAWDAAVIIYLSGTWWMFFKLDEEAIKCLAAEEDEDRISIFILVIAALAISLVSIFKVLSGASSGSALEQMLATPVALATLLISWLLLHTIFTLHYAHLYFGDYDKNGTINGGVQFPYQGDRSYIDFVYLSLNIAVAFQLADIKTQSKNFRNTIIIHSMVSYMFNTIVLALGINIAGNLIR